MQIWSQPVSGYSLCGNLERDNGNLSLSLHHNLQAHSDLSAHNQTQGHPRAMGEGPIDSLQSEHVILPGEPGGSTTPPVPQLLVPEGSMSRHFAYSNAYTQGSQEPSCPSPRRDGGVNKIQFQRPSSLTPPCARRSSASPSITPQRYHVLHDQLQQEMKGPSARAEDVRYDSVASLAAFGPGQVALSDTSPSEQEPEPAASIGSESRYTVSSYIDNPEGRHGSFAHTASSTADQSSQSFVHEPTVTLPWPSTSARDHVPQIN